MVDIETSDLDSKLTLVNLWLWRVKFGNHGNQTILVWELKPYLFSSGSHCLTTVTMVGDIIMETKVCSLP
jgi:hypothetical protein